MATVRDAALDAVRAVFGGAADAGARVTAATDLLAVGSVLGREPRLRSALTDPSVPAEAKRALAESVFGGRVAREAVDGLVTLVGAQRLRPRELPDAVDATAAQALMDAADEEGSLATVEGQLMDFAGLVERDHGLRSALTDPVLPGENKRALMDDLLTGRADPIAQALLTHWIERDQARQLSALAEGTVRVASARRNRVVADVTSAVALDDEQRARLASAFERVTGKPVDLRVEVDDSVVGALSVRIGDEVYDGTVKRQLELARERLGA